MTKINKYWQPKTKRVYTRKNQFNKTYNKKFTQRELEKRVKIAWTVIIVIILIGTCQWLTVPRTITIQGNGLAVEASECVPPQLAGDDLDNLLSPVDEVDWSEIPYIEKDKGTVEEQIRAIAKQQNFKWENYLVNLACCEGLLKTDTINDKGNYPAWSIDRGLYGINNYWHAEVSDEVAYDLEASTLWTINHINNGKQNEFMCDKKIRGKKDYYKRCL